MYLKEHRQHNLCESFTEELANVFKCKNNTLFYIVESEILKNTQ